MINSVVLQGRLVADPELRTTTTGKSVCRFRIAVDRSHSKQGEDKKADFLPIVSWENTATFISRYFSKGSMIVLQGSITTQSYEGKDGSKKTAFEVLAREVHFCGSKQENTSAPSTQYPTNAASQAEDKPSAPTQQAFMSGDFEEIPDDEDPPF